MSMKKVDIVAVGAYEISFTFLRNALKLTGEKEGLA